MKAFVLEERNKAVIKDMPIPELDSDYGAILKERILYWDMNL